MNIEIKRVLAMAIGTFVLLAPATVQTPGRRSPPLPEKAWGGGAKAKDVPLRADAGGMGGLYGYRYRGF
jgi:hypothetical protein